MPYDPSPEMNDPRQTPDLPVRPIFPYPPVNRCSNAKHRGEFFLLRSEHGSLMIFRQQAEKIRFLREITGPAVNRFDYVASRQWLLLGRGPTLTVIDLPSGRELARKECNAHITGIVCWHDQVFIAFANTLAEVELSYSGKLLFADVIPYPESIVDIAASGDGRVVIGQSGIYDGRGQKISDLTEIEEGLELNGGIYFRRGEGLHMLDGTVLMDERTLPVGPMDLLRWQGLALVPDMMFVAGGEYQMGAADCGPDAQPQHSVQLDSFLIGKHEVTFNQYDAYCHATQQVKPSDNDWGRHNRPVINVSWLDVIKYCNWQSRREGLAIAYDEKNGNLLNNAGRVTKDIKQVQGYRLPTEAEWEYAARGGAKTREYTYSGGNSLDELGWYDANSRHQSHPVGEKKANELGLYDMSGNVCEWCMDRYAYGYNSMRMVNPIIFSSERAHVIRGGGWANPHAYCRVAYRTYFARGKPSIFVGFRLARSAPHESNKIAITPATPGYFLINPELISPELPLAGYGLTADNKHLFLVLATGQGIWISLEAEQIIARFPHLEADDLRQSLHMKMFPDALVILRDNEVSGTAGWQKYITFIQGSDFCDDEALYQAHYRPLREMLNATN
jgi:formylglycine-generating enzyme required for sulfatase activity